MEEQDKVIYDKNGNKLAEIRRRCGFAQSLEENDKEEDARKRGD